MRLLHVSLLISVCSGAKAHQLHDGSIQISKLWQSSTNYIRVIIDKTHSGNRIRCALYDEEGQILAVDEENTEELATEMMISSQTFSVEDVKSYRCVYDN